MPWKCQCLLPSVRSPCPVRFSRWCWPEVRGSRLISHIIPRASPTITGESDSACQTVRVGGLSDDTIRNVTFRNIRAKGHNGIRFDYPPRYLLDGDEGSLDVHGITFENYSGEFTACALQITVGSGVKLRGVRDVLFEDFNVKSVMPMQFKGNIHTKPERVRRVNFTFNGNLLPDGEFVADCTDAGPLKRVPRNGPNFFRQRPAAVR